jgi:hypothetical protein
MGLNSGELVWYIDETGEELVRIISVDNDRNKVIITGIMPTIQSWEMEVNKEELRELDIVSKRDFRKYNDYDTWGL